MEESGDRAMIYLDHAATTRMEAGAVSAMLPFFSEQFGNPSAVYRIASKSKEAVAKARKQAASVIGADPSELYFTSGGTEADNWALTAALDSFASGAVSGRKGGRGHLITSAVEHPAILATCEYLRRERGIDVTYLPVNRFGCVDPEQVRDAIRTDTFLISVMTANNEVGTIEPVTRIGAIARERGILFHTDAVQAYGHIPLDVREMNIDLLSVSGHKFGGPKGTGFLYMRRGLKLGAFLHGGAQERNRRAGTENVPGIVGLGAAAEIASSKMEERARYTASLRDYLEASILRTIPFCHLNSAAEEKLPGTVNITFDYIAGESALILLDEKGICASAGSACSSGSINPSHVLMAMGLSKEQAFSSLRFSIGADNTKEEMDVTVREMKAIAERLRAMSPKYAEAVKRRRSRRDREMTDAGRRE